MKPLDDKNLLMGYYKSLCYFAWAMVRDMDLAEDLVQDAYVAYLKHKEHVSADEKAIKSFLYASIQHAVYNLNRKNKTIQKYVSRQDVHAVDEVDYEHRIIKAEFMAAVQLIVKELPSACQQVFKLSYFEGYSNQEICDELSLSINTVKTQKQRALNVLRKKIHPEFYSLLFLWATC